ncbi:hypothetical protein [Streptomyces sp. NPDC051162]|uniref:hypothetical protein n=1 Tax=unclassified Streptomyces TaxID=2593676 RepID=UPI003445EC31
MSKRQKGRRHRKVNRTPRPRATTAPPRPVVVPELGRHMARTWEGLRTYGAAGASLEELAEAVGYQARTVLKHVTGFAGQGLAELRDERWYARTG